MMFASLAGMLGAAAKTGGIEFVGGATGAVAGTTSSWTLSLTALTGGIATQPEAGDFVVVFYGNGDGASRVLSVLTAGYTARANLYANDGRDTNLVCATKMLSTPETTVELSGTGSTSNAGAAVVLVYRGVDPVAPLATAVETHTQVNTHRPFPPAISPGTGGAWVVAGGSGAHAYATDVTLTSTDLDVLLSVASDDTIDVVVAAGHVGPIGGSVALAQFDSTRSNNANDASAAVTLALRPA